MSNLEEYLYILQRKIKAKFQSLCFLACRIFPVDANLISVCSFEGRGGFGCNPKYIVEELHRRNPEYKFVWFVNDISKEFPDYIQKVQNTLWNRAYWLTKSKVWIDNYRKPYGTIKRKGQFYINTWHATISIKAIGLWRGKAFSKMAYLVSKNDSDMIDRVVIDSEYCAEMYRKGLLYDGEYLWAGTARCDILYGDRNKWKIDFREKYNIPKDAKVIMYAPTFREGAKNGKRSVMAGAVTLDFERMIDNLETRFGGSWYVCLRFHPQLANIVKEYKDSALGNRIIDITQVDDMYPALAAIDAFVTDYSSIAMDASLMHIPVFLYVDDLMRYVRDRGGMQWDFHEDSMQAVYNNQEMMPGIKTKLPYPIAQTNDELEKVIINFEDDTYNKELSEYEKAVHLIFDGKAASKIADELESYYQNCRC